MCTKDFKSTKAITLIALVITIVVLLILAGVSIVTLTGDNGILNQAQNAQKATTLAKMEEELNLVYMSIYTGKAGTGAINAGVSLDEIYNDDKLSSETKGHIHTQKGTSTITLVDQNQGSVTLLNDANAIGSTGTTGQNTVQVEVNEETNSTSYWLESDGTYYPMSIRNSRVELDKENATTEEPAVTGSLGDGITIGYIDNGATEETASSNYVTASRSISGTTITITITAIAEGRTQVVVRDGSVTLTGNIDVTVNPTYTISIGAVTNGSIGITTNNVNTTSYTKYGKDVEIKLTATGNTTPKRYAFEKWNDESTINPRTIQVSSTTAGTYTATFVESKLYGAQVELNGGNAITVKTVGTTNYTIEDNWKLFYIDDASDGYVHLIYGDYYPADVQTEITSGNTIFVPAHQDDNNNESSNSSYAWSVNSRTDRLTLLKYLKNNSSYAEANLDNSTPAGSYTSWTDLATALTGSGKALNGKTIRVQGTSNITMWVDSWNEQGYPELVLQNVTKGYNIARKATSGPNQSYYSSVSLGSETGYNDTLYFPNRGNSSTTEEPNANKAYGYWLASPSGNSYAGYVFYVYYDGTVWGEYGLAYYGLSARPVVSILKSDFQNITAFSGVSITK